MFSWTKKQHQQRDRLSKELSRKYTNNDINQHIEKTVHTIQQFNKEHTELMDWFIKENVKIQQRLHDNRLLLDALINARSLHGGSN